MRNEMKWDLIVPFPSPFNHLRKTLYRRLIDAEHTQATLRDKRSGICNDPNAWNCKLRQKAFIIVIALKTSLTAIIHGFKCGPEAIDNLGTNFNEGNKE